MNTRSFLLLLAPALLAGCASQSARERDAEALARHLEYAGAPVDSFSYLGRVDGWRPLGSNQLVVYTSLSDGYLLTLAPPCHDLRFANRIKINSTASTVSARFDTVTVDRYTCQITQIRPVDYGAVRRAAREERGYAR